MILEGWACRYKMLPEGTRQITAFLMPGDCCDMHASVLERMEHSIATLTPARVCRIPRARMEELILTRPALTRAVWWTQLVDDDTLRAWIVSMGRRTTLQSVARRMCEGAGWGGGVAGGNGAVEGGRGGVSVGIRRG